MCRRRLLAMGVAVAAGASAALVALSASPSTKAEEVAATSQSISEAAIISIAEQAAASSGDTSPTLIQHVEAPRAEAVEKSMGAVVEGNQDSVLIAEHGAFSGPAGPIPAHAPTSGSVLLLVMDAGSGKITDFAIQDSYPDLASIGAVDTDMSRGPLASAASVNRTGQRQRGVLKVQIQNGGGAPFAHGSPLPGVVSVFNGSGKLVARGHVKAGHYFKKVLAPGFYRLNAGEKLRYSSPIEGCAPRHAWVKAGRTTTTTVYQHCGTP
jgi:hypothetical protein